MRRPRYPNKSVERDVDDARVAMVRYLHDATEITDSGWEEEREAIIIGKRYYLIRESFPNWKVSDVRRIANACGFTIVKVTVSVQPTAINGVDIPKQVNNESS